MADVSIDSGLHSTQYYINNRGGPFWVSSSTAYVLYIDGTNLVYSKTADSGANWAAPTTIITGTILSFDAWADWQTTGLSGTKIHIVVVDANDNKVKYAYLDTNGDGTGTDDIEACQGTGTIASNVHRAYHQVSITKSRGGNLCVAMKYRDDGGTQYYEFYTSPDADTWTNEATCWDGSSNNEQVLLFPANLADSNDIWAAFLDHLHGEITIKTYDDSGDSWSEGAATITTDQPTQYMSWGGNIRHSDGKLLLAVWNDYDAATADLDTYEVTDEDNIAQKATILTDSAETFLAGLFIDQNNDYVYVAYAKGGTIMATVTVYYQYSDDDMATWEGETAMQADAADDHRWISAGCHASDGNGFFMPVWFDDDQNELFVNTDNAVAMVPAAGGLSIPIAMGHYRMLRAQNEDG